MLSPDRIREIARDCEAQPVITGLQNAADLRALADELEMNQRPQCDAERRIKK
jgi:hypothetical protein